MFKDGQKEHLDLSTEVIFPKTKIREQHTFQLEDESALGFNITDLPFEILLPILSFLPKHERYAFSAVSRYGFWLSKDSCFYEQNFAQTFTHTYRALCYMRNFFEPNWWKTINWQQFLFEASDGPMLLLFYYIREGDLENVKKYQHLITYEILSFEWQGKTCLEFAPSNVLAFLKEKIEEIIGRVWAEPELYSSCSLEEQTSMYYHLIKLCIAMQFDFESIVALLLRIKEKVSLEDLEEFKLPIFPMIRQEILQNEVEPEKLDQQLSIFFRRCTGKEAIPLFFLWAKRYGNVNVSEKLLILFPECQNPNYEKILKYALEAKDKHEIKFIIEKLKEISAVELKNSLEAQVALAFTTKNLKIIEMFLQEVKIFPTSHSFEVERALTNLAGSNDVRDMLILIMCLQAGKDININLRGNFLENALLFNGTCALMLLDLGTDLTLLTLNGTLAHLYAQNANYSEDLANKIMPHIVDDIDAVDNKGNTALHLVRNVNITQKLVALGADVNSQNLDRETPLMSLFFRNSAHVNYFSYDYLLNIEPKNLRSHSLQKKIIGPLIPEVFFEICEILIVKGSDINLAEQNGLTPLNHVIYKCITKLMENEISIIESFSEYYFDILFLMLYKNGSALKLCLEYSEKNTPDINLLHCLMMTRKMSEQRLEYFLNLLLSVKEFDPNQTFNTAKNHETDASEEEPVKQNHNIKINDIVITIDTSCISKILFQKNSLLLSLRNNNFIATRYLLAYGANPEDIISRSVVKKLLEQGNACLKKIMDSYHFFNEAVNFIQQGNKKQSLLKFYSKINYTSEITKFLNDSYNADPKLFNLLLLNSLMDTKYGLKLNPFEKKELMRYVLSNSQEVEIETLKNIVILAREGRAFILNKSEVLTLVENYKQRCEKLVEAKKSEENMDRLTLAQRMFEDCERQSNTKGV